MCYTKITLLSYGVSNMTFYYFIIMHIFAFKAQKQLCNDVQQNKSS